MVIGNDLRPAFLGVFVIVGLFVSALSAGALDNAGFEVPDKGGAGYEYEPAGASWAFSPGAGVAGPNSSWKCDSTSPDPLGDQFAYLQNAASIAQAIDGLIIGGHYKVSFYEAYRTQMQPGNNLLVILDEGLATEATIYTNTDVNSTTWVLRESDSFVAEKRAYTLTFRSTHPLASGDRSTIIDGVSLDAVGFEPISYALVSSDADSGIRSSRNYTHAIDFQANGTPATVNGVVFASVPGNGAGFTRVVANGGSNNHNGTGVISTTGGLASLMQGFIFNGSPATDGSGLQTYTLSGLTSGTIYDLRIYTHAYSSDGNRPNSLVFDVGGADVGTGEINEDNATSVGMPDKDDSYYINYRFTATGSNLVFTAANGLGSNASWHLYGLTCEQAGPAATGVKLIDSGVGIQDAAKLRISFDDDIDKGTGAIRLRRLNDDSVVELFDVTSAAVSVDGAEVTVDPSTLLLTIGTDYYVEIDAGAFTGPSGVDCYEVAGSSLLNVSTPAEAITVVPISSDADCDIGTNKQYTHKLDLGTDSPGALINGVQFDAYGGAANGSLNFNYAVSSGSRLAHAGNAAANVSGELAKLLKDMYINNGNLAGGTTTWTLSGLTAKRRYNTRIYVRRWGPSDNRIATMVFDPDGAGPISETTAVVSEDNATSVGMPTGAQAYYINYRFMAVAGEDLVITVTQHNGNNSWHLYGITNEEIPPDGMLLIVR